MIGEVVGGLEVSVGSRALKPCVHINPSSRKHWQDSIHFPCFLYDFLNFFSLQKLSPFGGDSQNCL